MTDINKQFEAVRSLRLEVNVEYVGQLLSSQPQPLPRKSGFGFNMLMGALIGSVLLSVLLSSNSSHRSAGTPLQNTPSALAVGDTLKPDISDKEVFSFAVQPVIDTLYLKANLNTEEMDKKRNTTIDNLHFKNEPTVLDTSKFKTNELIGGPDLAKLQKQHSEPIHSIFYLNDTSVTAGEGMMHHYTIRKEEKRHDLFMKFKDVYNCGMTVLISKCKERNGTINHLKLTFSYTTVNCRQSVFYTVDLKGFDTFSFGWDETNNGSIENFWSQLNNGKKARISDVYNHKGEFKYHHKQ
jgi:hypothetical protein